jgi:autotransporter-associated beta strand protein
MDVGGDAGATAADSGTVNHSAGDIAFVSGGGNQLLVGFVGAGTYNLSGGTLTTTASTSAGVTLGVRPNSTATFNLSGTGSLQMEAGSILQIGRSQTDNSSDATNLFNQSGGVANVGILSIGGVNTGTERAKRGTHTLTVTGGTFTANSFPRLAAADGNTATINIGGTADVTLPDFPTARGSGATATLTFDGGTLRPAAASANYMSNLTAAYIKVGGAKFDVDSGKDITIVQPLLTDLTSLNGGLTKIGAGILTLAGTNTYTGNTTVSNGTLAIQVASIAASSTVSVAEGAVLQLDFPGTNVVAGFVTNGVSLPAGVYSLALGNAGSFLTGAGSLQVGAAPSGPTLTSVAPNPVFGSSYPVTLSLTGTGFTGATAVLLTNVTAATGASYVPTVNSDTSISVSFVPGTAPTSWSATVVNVTPSAQVPFTVSAPPAISISSGSLTSAGAGKVVLSGTGGTAGQSYAVLSATNVTQSLATWTPLVTNVFGAGGSFSYTNVVNPGTPQLFLRIKQ